jgi:hypothetical protein
MMMPERSTMGCNGVLSGYRTLRFTRAPLAASAVVLATVSSVAISSRVMRAD